MTPDTLQAIVFGGAISMLVLLLNVIIVCAFFSASGDSKFIGIPAHIVAYTILLGFTLVAIGADMAVVLVAYIFFFQGKAP